MHVIKHFFLTNASSHGTLVMQLFYIVRSTCAAFRLIVVFFFNACCNIVVVVVIAVFVRFQSVFSRKQHFFSYWSCSTNSFFIQTIGSCMHARLCMFLVWFVVVLLLLLLQTAHDGHRCHHCSSCYLELQNRSHLIFSNVCIRVCTLFVFVSPKNCQKLVAHWPT